MINVISKSNSVYAASRGNVFGHKFSNGIDDITIYIEDTDYPRATYWQNFIQAAVNNWMYTGYGGNNFYASYVSSPYYGSNMDFYSERGSFFPTQSNGVVLAYTVHLTNGVEKDPYTQDWYYAEIYLNDDALSSSSVSNSQAQGTIAHEIGHAFGLAHNNSNVNSIMCQTYVPDTGNRRVVQTVQLIDNNTLNYLYP